MKYFKRSLIVLMAFATGLSIIGIVYIQKHELQTSKAPGSPAPPLNILTIKGDTFNLAAASDTAVIYLSFLRFTTCPVCNYRMHELMERQSELMDVNVFPVVIFESNSEVLKKYNDHYKISIEMIADPNGELYSRYEVENNLLKAYVTSVDGEVDRIYSEGEDLFSDTYDEEGNLARLPADFLIYQGKIVTANYGQNIADNMAIDYIIEQANRWFGK